MARNDGSLSELYFFKQLRWDHSSRREQSPAARWRNSVRPKKRELTRMRRIRNRAARAAIVLCAVASGSAQGTGQDSLPGISLRIERSFAAPRDRVFSLWTDPQAVAKWFLPPQTRTGRSRRRLTLVPEAASAYGSLRKMNCTICTEHFSTYVRRRNLSSTGGGIKTDRIGERPGWDPPTAMRLLAWRHG